MKKNILILNQSLNDTFTNTYIKIIENYGMGTIISGSYSEESNSDKVSYISAPKYSGISLKSRFISWFKYIFFVIKWSKKSKLNFDLVFVSSNPAIGPILGLYFKIKKKIPYIVLVWDIYPNVIEVSITNIFVKPLIKIWYFINKYIYRNADSIITIGNTMSETIKNDYLKENLQIDIIPNWADPEFIKPIDKQDNPFIKKHNLNDKLVVLYSGKMGLGHDLDTILKAAKGLESYIDIIFLFVGHGPGYTLVEKIIDDTNPSNVLLLPLQSKDMFPFSITSGDIGIVAQEKGLAHLFMPCKTYNLMSAGSGIISISEGKNDLRETIESNNIGFNVEPGDSIKLKDKILELRNNKKLLYDFKCCSRNAILTKYNSNEIIDQYLNVFDRVLLTDIKES